MNISHEGSRCSGWCGFESLSWKAIWDNHAVWHSATGGLADDERRVMHLVAFDGVAPPRTTTHPIPSACLSRPPLSILGLVIGQTPRDDLVVPLRRTLASACTKAPALLTAADRDDTIALTVRGALDGVTADAPIFMAALPWDSPLDSQFTSSKVDVDACDCPLITRLSEGTQVTVREAELTPLLQAQLDAHATALGDHACVAVLLCAGRFDGLRAPSETMSLLRPFEAAAAMAAHLGVSDALLCVPTEAQRPYAIARWRTRLPAGAKLHTCVLPEAPDAADLGAAADAARALGVHAAVVVDFVGQPEDVLTRLRELMPGRLVVDVGSCALSLLEGWLLSQTG